jgi:hypothetical protein
MALIRPYPTIKGGTDWSQYDVLPGSAFLSQPVPANGFTLFYTIHGQGFLTQLYLYISQPMVVPSLIVDGVEKPFYYSNTETSVFLSGGSVVGNTPGVNIFELNTPIYFSDTLQVKLKNLSTSTAYGANSSLIATFHM